jgi:SAM-dependent methyltransferase
MKELDPQKTRQRDEFLFSEGDGWFRRNSAHLATQESLSSFLLGRLIPQHDLEIPAVLEIGCGDGRNLESFATDHCNLFGTDPSSDAVRAGRVRNPELNLAVGCSDELDFEDESFDVVLFGFCLYLVDRSLLFRSVAEADRVLKSGGQLIIIDFDPDAPTKRSYVHVDGLYSHKMDYSRLFLANPAYTLAEKISSDHRFSLTPTNPSERVAIWSLKKNAMTAYVEELPEQLADG